MLFMLWLCQMNQGGQFYCIYTFKTVYNFGELTISKQRRKSSAYCIFLQKSTFFLLFCPWHDCPLQNRKDDCGDVSTVIVSTQFTTSSCCSFTRPHVTSVEKESYYLINFSENNYNNYFFNCSSNLNCF